MCILVSLLCLPSAGPQAADQEKQECYEALLICFYFFLLTTCLYLSALSLTVRIMANEQVLNAYTFKIKNILGGREFTLHLLFAVC